jgi:hypothetical protein
VAVDPVPFFVGGGAEHSPEVVRQGIFDYSSGAEGISSPTALRVLPWTTPTTKIRVMPGGALLNNRYPGGEGQSYTARNATQTEVPITANGSATARTDLVVLRILDPQYQGQPPADPKTFLYTRIEVIQGVSASIRSARELNLAYPAIALARVTIPGNTVARPTLTTDPAVGMTLTYTTATGEWFPNAGGDQRLDVPEWANSMLIEADWMGILYGPENAVGWGDYWIDYGPVGAAGTQQLENSTVKFRWDAPRGDFNRHNWRLVQEVPVPSNMRGKSGMQFIFKARREANTTLVPKMDHRSGVALKVTFKQVPTLSDS